VPLAVLHFVARRRLPAVKRTAAMRVVSACKIKTVPPAALRIHSAATRPNNRPRPVLIPAPFRRSHTPKANPLRGIASQKQTELRVSSLRSTAHRRAGVNSPLRVEL
jgi:predicted nucleic acid-binding Zn ribbon protein